MISVSVDLDEYIIQKIDLLVRKGLYQSRSEAVRTLVTKGVERVALLEEDHASREKVQRLLDLVIQNEEGSLDILRTEKTAVDLVSEGRER